MMVFVLRVVLLFIGVIALGTTTAFAQFEEARKMAQAFPAELDGFETDDPLITYERNNDRQNLHIELIYYRTDGSEEVHIELDEFEVNSQYFNRQYSSVQQLADSVGDPQYYYKGYLKQERYDKRIAKKVIYLNRQRILTITHSGHIKNEHLIDEILRTIELEKITGL